jgi:hypothetical protein
MNIQRELHDLLTVVPKATLPNDCGVGVLADCTAFPGVQLLYTSLVKTHHNVRLFLADLGLSPSQLAWCREQPRLSVRTVRDEELIVKRCWVGWQCWNRPVCLKMSPFKYTLWLDADCLVRGSLLPLFGLIQHHPFMPGIPEFIPNYPQLYEFLKWRSVEEQGVCAAVFGWRRDRAADHYLVEDWYNLTQQVTSHPSYPAQHVHLCDEGLLRAILWKKACYDYVVPGQQWHHLIREVKSISDALEKMAASPNVICHFQGAPKYWDSVGDDLLDIRPHLDL